MGMRGTFGKLRSSRRDAQPRTVLSRLASDTRGNTLAIMAAALIPFCGMVGGGIDLSRMYITKTRLQHACDAGALAGRKTMGAGTWTASSGAANTAAQQFFDANFSAGSYGSYALTKTFSENAGKVTGTASASLPMTLMAVLGKGDETLTVTCDAEMRLPNTDIMFVLDTTGSMEEKAVNTDSKTKIVALKSAVKCFYEIVSRLDTTENCSTGTPSGGVGGQVQVRFGFVPYATNVNVGRLLPTAWLADTWSYDTRQAMMRTESYTETTGYTTTWTNGTRQSNGADAYKDLVFGSWAQVSNNTVAGSSSCVAPAANDPVFTGAESARYEVVGPITSGSTRTTTWKTDTPGKQEYTYQANYNSGTRRCLIERMRITGIVIRSWKQVDTSSQTPITETRTRTVFDKWRYNLLPVDIRGLKNGTNWNSGFQAPIGDTASGAATVASKQIDWDGCIEERKTTRQTTYTSSKGGTPKDLDIDTAPSASDPESLWGPALHGMIYARGSFANDLSANDVPGFNRNELQDNNNYATIAGNRQDSYYCPTQASKLRQWNDATEFEGYVNGITTGGNTYHDIGLLWGARFLSANGMFASENALTPQGGELDRNLIFMTDGETCTGMVNYGPYGMPWYDRRQTADNAAPTDGCETETATGGTLSEQVNARYAALCNAVKNSPSNITLWVIWFGVSKPNLEARLRGCATTGRFYTARDEIGLQSTFASIANQISSLRLTR